MTVALISSQLQRVYAPGTRGRPHLLAVEDHDAVGCQPGERFVDGQGVEVEDLVLQLRSCPALRVVIAEHL
ncbi:MAG TPA: hypothetical protein VNV42_08525 [Solirubrobacteraceae bacterium]|jgi:hypothetical protein|nr:hypothetical protein [Solirubrobacteraceae bacterium]